MAYNDAIEDESYYKGRDEYSKLEKYDGDDESDICHPSAHTENEDLSSGTEINVGYFMTMYEIKDVYIGVKYKNGQYLEDMVNDGSATKEQRELYEKLKIIENSVHKRQMFDVESQFVNEGYYNMEEIRGVFNALNRIHNGEYTYE